MLKLAEFLGDLDACVDDVFVASLDCVRALQLLRVVRSPGLLNASESKSPPKSPAACSRVAK